MRSIKSIEGRLEALEEGSGPLIDDLADLVRWCSEDCPSSWQWDPKFERRIAELAAEIADEDYVRL
jgi:hypothetical protein